MLDELSPKFTMAACDRPNATFIGILMVATDRRYKKGPFTEVSRRKLALDPGCEKIVYNFDMKSACNCQRNVGKPFIGFK